MVSHRLHVIGPLAGCISLLACVRPGYAVADVVSRPEVEFSGAWDSAYVTEGRDNLDEGGLVSAAVDVAWDRVALFGWAARGDHTDYEEYNVGLSYALDLGSVSAEVMYTRFEYRGADDAPGDNEFSLRCSASLAGLVQLECTGRYATEAAGAFLEWIVRRDCDVGSSGVTITPYALAGVDLGYASNEFDGLNHVEAGIALSYPLGERMAVTLRCARSWAQRDVRREGLGNLTWGGASLAASF